MKKIPKVSEAAMREAHAKFQEAMNDSMVKGDPFKMFKTLRESQEKFYKEQPEIYEYISCIMESHCEATEGMIIAPQLELYVMVVLNSMYIQQEMNEVGDLFEEDK
jgi:hypothetical protein